MKFKFLLLIVFLVFQAKSNYLGFKIDENPFEAVQQKKSTLGDLLQKKKDTTVDPKAFCGICSEVYEQQFDTQSFIQSGSCDKFQAQFGISREQCIQFSKQTAQTFFNNGGDSFFEKNLYQMVKNCRNINKNDLEQHQSYFDLNCDKVSLKVCDALLFKNQNECFTVSEKTEIPTDLIQKKLLQNRFQEVEQQQPQFDFEQIRKNYMNSNDKQDQIVPQQEEQQEQVTRLENLLKEEIQPKINTQQTNSFEFQKVPEPKKLEWAPEKQMIFKGQLQNVDTSLDEINRLESKVNELESKLKATKQELFSKIVQAQAASKSIQDHLNQIVSRVKNEMN